MVSLFYCLVPFSNYLDAGTYLQTGLLARGGLSCVPLEVSEATFAATRCNLAVT